MEINGADSADVPERLEIPEMVVAGNDQVGFACDRAFQYQIIVVIRRNRAGSEVGNDNFRDLRQQLQLSSDLFVIPVAHQNFLSKPAGGKAASGTASATETDAEDSGQVVHSGRRNQKYMAIFHGV